MGTFRSTEINQVGGGCLLSYPPSIWKTERVPLSEYEERMIAEFERQFVASEPPEMRHQLSASRVVQIGVVGVSLGFLLMLLALPVSVLLAFAGFLICFASGYWLSIGVREGGWDDLAEKYRRPSPRRRSTDL
jgi:hypothetical protein